MALWLFALFLAIPLIEIALFIVVGGEIGLWPTLGIVVATGIMGAALFQYQGLAVARDARMRIERGEAPIGSMFHGICLITAAAFLVTPGFFTDVVGLLLLLPPVRAIIVRLILKKMQVNRKMPPDDGTIDGEYRDVTPDPPSTAAAGDQNVVVSRPRS